MLRRELDGAAERHGWAVAKVFEDVGTSGSKAATNRGLDALLKGVARRELRPRSRVVG